MAINRVEIKDFLVFKGEFSADFCPGVNVLIGGNGTGKTTLMKAMYAITRFPTVVDRNDYSRNQTANVEIIDYFAPRSDATDKYSNINSGYSYEFQVRECRIIINNLTFGWKDESEEMEREMRQKNDKGSLDLRPGYFYYCTADLNTVSIDSTVYIPVGDMLSHSNGLLALSEKYSIPFDRTHIDTLWNAGLPESRGLSEKSKELLDRIAKLIKGTVTESGGTFYKVEDGGSKIPFSLEASGYKKLGLLWKLLRNGLLEPGSILFWDEPENSLNPELVPILVEILLKLANSGVQIFIATHDYNIARYFDVRKDKNIPVKFHNLTKNNDGQIVCNSSQEYLKLPDNKLETASADLFNAVVNAGFEALEGNDE